MQGHSHLKNKLETNMYGLRIIMGIWVLLYERS